MIFGSLLVLLGLSIILKAVFHIDLPLFRIIVALFFIYVGVKMLIRPSWTKNSHEWSSGGTTVFSNRNFEKADGVEREYNVVFGKSTVDLTSLPPDKKSGVIEVNTVFGDTLVFINSSDAIEIKLNAVFGSGVLPNGNSISFGEHYYKTNNSESGPVLRIDANVVFGSLRFMEKQ